MGLNYSKPSNSLLCICLQGTTGKVEGALEGAELVEPAPNFKTVGLLVDKQR
jgi:hypothetical protein